MNYDITFHEESLFLKEGTCLSFKMSKQKQAVMVCWCHCDVYKSVLVPFLLLLLSIPFSFFCVHLPPFTPSHSSLHTASLKWEQKERKGGSQWVARIGFSWADPLPSSRELTALLPIPGWPIDKWHGACTRWTDSTVHACLRATDGGRKQGQTIFHP